ncbi:MAG: hypothetical protein ACK5L9_13800, partial [Paracoccus sp. (in: a-proteobacteria)]
RLWRKALRASGGDTAGAQRQLGRIEQNRLREDARRIWGEAYPLPDRAAWSRASICRCADRG